MRMRGIIITVLFIAIVAGVYLQARFSVFTRLDGVTYILDWMPDMRISREPAKDTEINGQKVEREILYWVAPMDPNFRSDEPGKSPMGMALVPVYADAATDVGTVTISPEVVNNMGVRTARVEKGILPRRIDTVGYIDFDESRISHVHLRAEGWIHHLAVDTEGDRVKKGQLLFNLYSPTLVNAQEEYLQAVASRNSALSQASRERLLALGLDNSQIDNLKQTGKPSQYVATYASQSGVVSVLNVRHGMYVKPETEVLSLASLDTIWIEAEVFERQANWVKSGQPAEAQIPAMPGRTWRGKVDYVYPVLDPITRTLRVRLRFENPGELLKPNMYADVSILSEPSEPVIHISREALINDGRNSRVILALGNGRFRAKNVTAGMESGDRIEIIEGLDVSDVVVVSAQFLIDSEASLKASFRRMEPVSEKEVRENHFHTEGEGTINSIDDQARTINISHKAIDTLNWPAMTIDFRVADHVTLDFLRPGENIRFYLARNAEGEYIISNLLPAEEKELEND